MTATTPQPARVTIAISATAPADLEARVAAFAAELEGQGIAVDPVEYLPTCTVCGCSEDHACPEGCAWATQDPDLCTACVAKFTHTEHIAVDTYARTCIDGGCEHVDENRQPEDLADCPSTTLDVCIDCMHELGHGRIPDENWDDVALALWPHDTTALAEGVQDA